MTPFHPNPIDTLFEKDGFLFELIKRQGRIALFEKSKPTHTRSTFEVVKLEQRKEHTWPNGKTTPAHESMPASETWGVYGFSYIDRESANKKFLQLT
jgi:hypothetical protein